MPTLQPLGMDMESNNPKASIEDGPRKRLAKHRPKEYSGSRWAGLVLLIISFIISLIFYARSGAADFFSALFSPAKYTIQK